MPYLTFSASAAREHGLDEDTAQKALQNGEGMDPHHKAAVAFATDLMTQPKAITQELLEELREFFSDDQLIELTLDDEVELSESFRCVGNRSGNTGRRIKRTPF